MKIEDIDANDAIENAQRLLKSEKKPSLEIKAAFEVILLQAKI